MLAHNIKADVARVLRSMAINIKSVEQKLASLHLGNRSLDKDIVKRRILRYAEEIKHLDSILAPDQVPHEVASQSLQKLLDKICKKRNIQCEFHCDDKTLLDSFPIGVHIYHMLRTSLTEIAHSPEIESVVISLGGTGNWRRLVLEANASGPLPLVDRSSPSYQLLKLRTKIIGGNIEAKRYGDEKAVIRCRFPFKQADG